MVLCRPTGIITEAGTGVNILPTIFPEKLCKSFRPSRNDVNRPDFSGRFCPRYSTITLLARFRGLSISQPSHKSRAFAGTLSLTQIVRTESGRFQDFARCAKCLHAAPAANQRGCTFSEGLRVIPPSRSWQDSGAYRYRSPAGAPHNRQTAAAAPHPERAAPPDGSPAPP